MIQDALKRFFYPHPSYTAGAREDDRLRQQILAATVGLGALLLAFSVVHLDKYWPPVCARGSISHYFHEPFAGTVFVMALAAIATFMFTYGGHTWSDAVVATIAAGGAVTLAFFPTHGLACPEGVPVDLRPAIQMITPENLSLQSAERGYEFRLSEQTILGDGIARLGTEASQFWHQIGAAVVFAALFYFVAFAFPRKNADTDVKDGKFIWVKRLRRGTYYTLAAVMVLGAVMALLGSPDNESAIGKAIKDLSRFFDKVLFPNAVTTTKGLARPVFFGELLLLWAFGISWLIHGRFLVGSLWWRYFGTRAGAETRT